MLAVLLASGSAAWGASSFTVSDLGADHAPRHGGWEAIVVHVGADAGATPVRDALIWAPLAHEKNHKPVWSGGGGGSDNVTLNSMGRIDANAPGKPGAADMQAHAFNANWDPQKIGGSGQIDLHVLKTGAPDSAHGGGSVVAGAGGWAGDGGSAVAVPLPAAAWTGLITLAGLGGLAAIRRYRLA